MYKKVVQNIIESHKESPIDILGIGDKGEYDYLLSQKSAYIRTIRDIDRFFTDRRKQTKILEIGSFLGTVSLSLKKLGYSVYSTDIPEFYQSLSLRKLYDQNDIPFSGLNLREGRLPYDSDSFDAIIICEVIEHLNFNPLPVLNEINRVLKKGGIIYIGMPNHANIVNRIKLLSGSSIHNPIDDFFRQLDKNYNMIVGLHWREYTLSETVRLIEEMGFNVVRKYYFADKSGANFLIKSIKYILYSVPSFRPSQIVIGRKVFTPQHNFWSTEANS